ncbi:hypothetical protein QBC47DRAFT_434633 [Echria macrotheca]|uniref:Heterokaryon incompatibility domain-containing protein n=1 Tax=Echria macrotheca TaxID=438768 RepID=A0AAJ0B652_9PEZI|nr:hypothetical protein QBC47DRAFT_434633 [Echria macrotheca]
MQLFVLSPDTPEAEGPHLHVANLTLGLQAQPLDPSPSPAPFICISYSWGTGRTPSPFCPSELVSDRTIPALHAVLTQRPLSRAFWVDAFCVPGLDSPAERAATLESMGFIYSRAEEVIVVLTGRALPALEQIGREENLLPSHLDALEREDWVTRAWTYQEAVNARRLRVTCHDAPPGVLVDCLQLFSYLGHAINSLGVEERSSKHPRLNAFEDVMVDCAVAMYLERSALQVMAIMDERTQTRVEDHFYAMMGAISTEPAASVVREAKSPCEAFMALCEKKGDYSFVFSSVGRDAREGRRWRPVEDERLPAILRLSSRGSGLRGRADGDKVVVEDVVVFRPGPISDDSRGFVARWLEGYKPARSYADLELEHAAFEALCEMGFTGSSECVETNDGLFFPQTRLGDASELEIIVAVGIEWRLGSPALGRYQKDDSAGGVLYTPGVFFGILPEGHCGETVIL